MNLYEKPLYALRDLGVRIGVPSATSYQKNVLIEKIYERAKQIENGMPDPPKSTHGRPKLKSCFIEIDRDENGKIIFSDATAPEKEKTDFCFDLNKPAPKSKKEKEKEIKRLLESKKVFETLIDAIDSYIKTLKD